MFRLIENKKAKNPYYHEMISIHIYTMEELCYYMESNIYLIDGNWAGEPLIQWIKEELGEQAMAEQLFHEYNQSQDVYQTVGKLFELSGYYSNSRLEELNEMLHNMQGKTSMERRKMRGDLLLFHGKYRQAAYHYLEILQPPYTERMTEELQGNIWHNLGVVYARLFLFSEAADAFSKAYQLRKTEETRNAYLYAMNYLDDSCSLEEQGMDLSFQVMKEALAKVSEVMDQSEYYVERKAASSAANAYDWRSKQGDLQARWQEEYIGCMK